MHCKEDHRLYERVMTMLESSLCPYVDAMPRHKLIKTNIFDGVCAPKTILVEHTVCIGQPDFSALIGDK